MNLVQRLAAREPGAMESIVERYTGLVKKVVASMGLRWCEDDIVQMVWIRVWSGAGTYRPEMSKESTWISTIARNVSVSAMRDKAYRPLPKDPRAREMPHPGAVLETAEEAARVMDIGDDAVLEELILQARGMKIRTISLYLGKHDGTVKTRMRRARAALRVTCRDQ